MSSILPFPCSSEPCCWPHMTLEGLRPDDSYYNHKPEKPKRDAKTVPGNIERHVYAETRVTAYRLKTAA